MRNEMRHGAMRIICAVSVASGLLGCERTQLLQSDPITLTPNKWTSVGATLMRVTGPQSELCLEVPSEFEFADTAQLLVRSGNGPIALRGRLIRSDGTVLDSLDVGFRSGERMRVCFLANGRPRGEEYREAQLTATDSVVVRDIRWWSGEHRGIL